MNEKYVSSGAEYADHVKCNRCGFNGLIDVGRADCPECGKDDALMGVPSPTNYEVEL